MARAFSVCACCCQLKLTERKIAMSEIGVAMRMRLLCAHIIKS